MLMLMSHMKQFVYGNAFVIKRSESKNITAIITDVCHMLEIDHVKLNVGTFLLNTPDITYNLLKGMNGIWERRFDVWSPK